MKSYPVQHEHLSDMLLSTLGEIGMEQLRFVSEIALKSLFLYSGASPLAHLCSTSAQGTPPPFWDTKYGPGKMFSYSSYLLPLLNGHLYSGERDTFCGS